MSRATVILNSRHERERVASWAQQASPGTIVEFRQSKRTLDQNARLWACLTEIARKVEWHGMKLPADDWKDIFTAALRKHRFVPGLDANTVVPLGMRTSDMTKQEFGDLLELINAFAAERGIEFQDYQSSDTPADDTGSDGKSPSPESTVAADLSEPADEADEEEGAPETHPDKPADGQQAAPSSDPIRTRADCIKAFMTTATDPDLDVAGRRDLLEQMKDWWKADLPNDLDFVKACLATADKVAKGELGAEAARKYLEGLL